MLAAGFDRGEQTVELALRLGHQRFGRREHCRVHPKTACDGESVGTTRNTLRETVCRRQRRSIEVERAIHHARHSGGKGLERTEMRRRERQ